MVPRIKKASHRREAVAYRLSLTAAIQSLVMRQRSDPSINLRPYIEKYKAELDEVIAEIARYDKLRNLCLSDDDDDGTVSISEFLLKLPTRLQETRRKRMLTLKNISERTGISESRLSENERSNYQGVKLCRLQEIAAAIEFRD